MDGLPNPVQSLFIRLVVENTPRIITLSTLDRDQYALLFQQWLRIATSPLKEPELTQLTWIQMLLLFLFERSYSSPDRLSVFQIAGFLRTNLTLNVQISDLARRTGMSESGFRKQFSKTHGTTPKHFQQICRLTEAKWLLSSSEHDMQTIAAAIGFSQLHSFSSWFKKMENTSPSDWRKAQRLLHE